MNKETIYIEPSDDITDILSKLKASDKKIVALVPPKKPTVLLSAVNIKLIARTAKAEKKAVVLISTDDALTKLAMTANLPVAKSLKSRPMMPGEEPTPEPEAKPAKSEAEEASETDTREDEDEPEEKSEDDEDEDAADDAVAKIEKEEKTDEKADDAEDSKEEEEEDEKDEEDDDDDDDDNEDDKAKKKAKQSAKKSKKDKPAATGFKGFLVAHKLWFILGSFLVLALTGFLIWAFVYAPDVTIAVSVRTTSSNFSENVVFTTQPADEKVETGIFYVHEEKLEKEQVVKFTATGKKDVGETASGEVILIAYFLDPGSVDIPAGSKFSHGQFDYTTTSAATITGPSKKTASAFKAVCDNYSDDDFEIGVDYCQVSVAVPVKAAAPGEDYNLSATNEGWNSSISGLTVVSRTDITGGTSKIVTVVQQSDVDLALDKMKSEEADNGKNELFAKISNTVMPIEASFKVEATDPKVSPAVGEEVKEGVTPQISTKTNYSVLTVDNVRIEEFIKQKSTVEEGKRLYSIGDPFVEYFSKSSDTTYSAKLKTTYKVGPEISETEILEKIQGEKIGRVEPTLKDSFAGISSVKIEKSYFWVSSVPNNPNQVRVELTVEE